MKAKLINGNLSFAPSTIILENGTAICNPTDEQLAAQGYKDVVYEEKPTITENQYLQEVYNDAKVITVSYLILENPVEEVYENIE